MPELPEVETTRRGIAPALVGARVREFLVRDRRLRWPVAAGLEAQVLSHAVQSVSRRAKYLLLNFAHGSLIVHLGMSGSLRMVRAPAVLQSHDHWDLVLDNGWTLRFHDPRRFGSLHWVAGDALAHPLLAALAPEPLSEAFDAAYLLRVTRKRSVAIKQFLMNSRYVVGVGNIYASEALFRAQIAPRRRAGRITRDEANRLVAAIKAVLAAAIETGGTTLRDYLNADGAPGYFRQQLNVYERAGEPCRQCGAAIKQTVQGQRSTYWCGRCQR